jgi:hypothetical protein
MGLVLCLRDSKEAQVQLLLALVVEGLCVSVLEGGGGLVDKSALCALGWQVLRIAAHARCL